jgi:hypothetical membrane protein
MKSLFEFIKNALSDKGEASSTRANVFIVVVQFSVVVTAGFVVVLRYFPFLIIEYLMIIVGAMLGVMGIKATEKVKSLPTNPEKKDETGS